MRYYSSATAAHALGVTPKVLDNILVRDAQELMPHGQRGKSRQLSFEIIETLALALILHKSLQIPQTRAISLAHAIQSSPLNEARIGANGTLTFDIARLRPPLEAALTDALEEVSRPRRGRPPGRSSVLEH